MKSREDGATLLEVLIALAIASLVAASAAGVARFGVTAIERAEAAAERSSEALILRRRVAEALTRVDPEGPSGPAALGSADAFVWRGAIARGETWSGGWWRLAAADGLTLERCDGANAGDCEEIERLGGGDARLAYAGSDGVWLDEWPAGRAPHLIRITVGGQESFVAPRVMGLSP